MSLARKAVRGAVWTIGLGISARLVGAVSTIAIAYFIAPEVHGEVVAAWFVAITASTATRLGLDQYLIVKHSDGADVPFHATAYTLLLGIPSLGAVLVLGDQLGALLNAPDMGQYIPGTVVAVAMRRVAAIPDRVLIRDLRFRTSALIQAVSEIAFVGTTLPLAAYGLGGHAIVIGNMIQAAIMLGAASMAAGWRSWLQPCRLTWQRTVDMMRFGIPLNIEVLLHIGASTWDSLMFSYRFGVRQMGIYDKAYNLADIPASHIGEHISGVLLPSMSKIEPHRRIDVLIRSTAILAVLLFPMVVGLAVVAETLIGLLLPGNWQRVAPFLLVLSAMAVFRPVSWVINSYMRVSERTRTSLCFEALKLVILLGSIAVISDPLWACAGVGLAFAVHSLMMILHLAWVDRVRPSRFLPGFLGPLLACAVMAAAVLGARHLLLALGADSRALLLVVEIAVGAVVYVPAAFVLAPGTTRDVLGLLRKAYSRRTPGNED